MTGTQLPAPVPALLERPQTGLRSPCACSVCGDPLDVCTEQRRLTFERCCPACSTRETHAAAHDQPTRGAMTAPGPDVTVPAVLAAADAAEPPLRLLLSGPAFDIAKAVYAQRLQTWAEW
ncbi:hypothetical protein [Nonomuraea jabiensis]|uniref:hypothetical protein n=1 Tax=Nonomuraea jabiensis TaxID=882448 RepID=UPI003D7441FE